MQQIKHGCLNRPLPKFRRTRGQQFGVSFMVLIAKIYIRNDYMDITTIEMNPSSV